MTQDQLQKELKEKVKPGVKPSQLKRSKSLSDIPKAPPLPRIPLTKSKSAEELVPSQILEQLETKISVLELKLETKERELVEIQAEQQLFAEQLKAKQAQIESLREKLETSPSSSELDSNLTKRHQNLKSWFTQYQKSKKLDKELTENIDQASTELVNQDQVISSLRSENNKLKQTNRQLTQDLKLSQRLAELRREPLGLEPNWPTPNFSWVVWTLTFIALWIWIKKPHD